MRLITNNTYSGAAALIILILNLHVFCAYGFLLNDLAAKISTAFRYYSSDDSLVSGTSIDRPAAPTTYKYNNDSDQFTLSELSRRENYPLESHSVVTEDGYILTVHRLPGRPGSTPVLLQHGLLESSKDFLLPGKGQSLPHILWEHGYDVWLGNARGNTYSKRHQILSSKDPEFWNFSWHELGVYDLPAVITYITERKGDSLFYIGHSMAGSTISVMASERPEMLQRVKAVIGLAPATFVFHVRSPVKHLVPYWRYILRLATQMNFHEFFPHHQFFDVFAKYMCQSFFLRNIVCSNSLFLIGGFNPQQLDQSLLPKIWSSFPSGTSVKLFAHWLQQMDKNEFRKFDYGSKADNLRVYNSSVPPSYDISKLEVPVALFWSENDWLVTGKDVHKFYREVPLKLGIHRVDHGFFNHFDFLWAKDAPELVYSKIIDILSDYSNVVLE